MHHVPYAALPFLLIVLSPSGIHVEVAREKPYISSANGRGASRQGKPTGWEWPGGKCVYSRVTLSVDVHRNCPGHSKPWITILCVLTTNNHCSALLTPILNTTPASRRSCYCCDTVARRCVFLCLHSSEYAIVCSPGWSDVCFLYVPRRHLTREPLLFCLPLVLYLLTVTRPPQWPSTMRIVSDSLD